VLVGIPAKAVSLDRLAPLDHLVHEAGVLVREVGAHGVEVRVHERLEEGVAVHVDARSLDPSLSPRHPTGDYPCPIAFRVPLLLLVLAALIAGCGDDSADDSESGGSDGGAEDLTETFDHPDFDITFEYPEALEPAEDVQVAESAGSEPVATEAVGVDSTNLILVQRFKLNTAVDDQNFPAAREETDALFSELAGRPTDGTTTEVAGLPAVEYRLPLTEPAGAETRAVAVFDGDDEYLLNCQSTSEERESIEQACDLALETFEPR
jgi:hypothetical protein